MRNLKILSCVFAVLVCYIGTISFACGVTYKNGYLIQSHGGRTMVKSKNASQITWIVADHFNCVPAYKECSRMVAKNMVEPLTAEDYKEWQLAMK
jgi:hypothetical protein